MALATLLPGILVGLRFFQDRSSSVDDAVADLASQAAAIAHLLDEKIQGTAQLQSGLARASDIRTGDRVACSRFLGEVLAQYPQYTGILTILPDGTLFCDSLQTGRELDLNDRAYFVAAREQAGGVVLEPVFGRLTGLPVLQIAHPVRSSDGALEFVLLASLDLKQFAESFRQQPDAMEILLFDDAGTVLAWLPEALHLDEIGQSIVGSDVARVAASEPGAHIAEMVEGHHGEPEVWAVAATSPLFDTRIRVMVGLPRAELLAAANDRLVQDIAALAVVSALLFAGVWLLAEVSIRRQVGRIGAMVRRLEDGDLGVRIPPPHPRGELGQLMTALNGAAESLERQRAAIADLDQQLRQSQKLEAVGQLTGGVAHDFNNLLTVIIGNAEIMAEDRSLDRGVGAQAELILKAAERGAELTSRLLAFARRQQLNPKPTDVNRLMADFGKLLPRTLGEQIEIEFALGDGLSEAIIDPGLLEGALLNLCINARDAMPSGGRLTLETAAVDLDGSYVEKAGDLAPGPYVMVAVTDTGTGMDAGTRARAFEPFFTTKDVGKGSGLGLSMVYGFAKQSNGHVALYSEPGRGTTVRLYLPFADAAGRGDAAAPAEAAPATGSERILLVEDDALVRDHVSAQLAGLGYRVVAVADGPSALRVLADDVGFDLLFTDMVMPGGMGGHDIAERARALLPGLPVLFTSGYSELAIRRQGTLEAGTELLQKPYRRHELAARLRAVLEGRR